MSVGKENGIMRVRGLLLLLLVFAGSSLSAQTFEFGGLVYKQCWSDRTYVYEHAVYVKQREDGFKYKGDIRIPQTVRYGDEDYRVVGVGDNAFKDCKDMTSCVFEGDIEWIGNWAFEGCTGLTELTIPSYYLDDVYQMYVYVGNGAFRGCHLESLTCMSGNPPIYNYFNQSNNYSSSYPGDANWYGPSYDAYDYWYYNNTTTLYVPVGTVSAYSEKGDFYRDKWGNYFTVIKEWGVEADDSVPGFYELLAELKPLCEETIIRIANTSQIAYLSSLNTLYDMAGEEGADISSLQAQLNGCFETLLLYVWIEGEGEGWKEFRVMSKHKDYIDGLKYMLAEIENKLEALQAKRIAYYKARRSGDDTTADRLKGELEPLYEEIQDLLFDLSISLEGFSLDNMVQDVMDFISAFEATIADSVPLVSSESRSAKSGWYSIKGQRLSGAPSEKGIYIHDGKTVLVK